MKALKILNDLIFTISKYADVNDIKEAIDELEGIQSRSCEGCKYYFKDKFCATCSNESINIVNAYGSNEPDVYLKVSDDFCCNKFEPKDKE